MEIKIKILRKKETGKNTSDICINCAGTQITHVLDKKYKNVKRKYKRRV